MVPFLPIKIFPQPYYPTRLPFHLLQDVLANGPQTQLHIGGALKNSDAQAAPRPITSDSWKKSGKALVVFGEQLHYNILRELKNPLKL